MTILSESTKMAATSVVGCLVTIGLIAFITSVILLINDFYISSVVAFTIAIILYIVAVTISFAEPHKRIKAIIPNDYSAVSLYDKYIVIGREGQIWELEEREPLKRSDEVEDD